MGQYYRETSPQRKGRAIWKEHERVVIDAANGRRIDLNEFSEATLFFERLTGINVPSEHSTFVDAIPNKNTGSALEPLRCWYEENRDRLYWDDQRREVMLTGRNPT
jgi:hypothetical protein